MTERGGDATSPGSEIPGPESVPTDYEQYDDDDVDSDGSDTSSSSSSSSAGGTNSTDATAGGSLSGASGNATANGTAAASANATAPVLRTVPVDPTLGYYDESIPLSVIPVAIAVLPSGKVRCLQFCSDVRSVLEWQIKIGMCWPAGYSGVEIHSCRLMCPPCFCLVVMCCAL